MRDTDNMGAKTGISWTDATWNFLVGCESVTSGCLNCYARGVVNRFAGSSPAFPERFDTLVVRDDKFMALPLRWAKPRMVFVNSLSDVFHKDVPDDVIVRAWAVMAATPRHTFQVLTKRHGRMRSVLSSPDFPDRIAQALTTDPLFTSNRSRTAPLALPVWPLPNVWVGISAEDQDTADLRVPALLATPAAIRWVSAEPLLGPVDLTGNLGERKINWVVVGGESQAGARRMDPTWAGSLRTQCTDTRTAFFFKQAGAVLAREWDCVDKNGSDPTGWPLPWPQEYPT